MVMACPGGRPAILNSFRQLVAGRSKFLSESSEPLLSSAQNNPHTRVALLGVACPEPHQCSTKIFFKYEVCRLRFGTQKIREMCFTSMLLNETTGK